MLCVAEVWGAANSSGIGLGVEMEGDQMCLGRRDTAYQDSILARAPRRPLLAPRGGRRSDGHRQRRGAGAGAESADLELLVNAGEPAGALVIGLAMNGALSTRRKGTPAVTIRAWVADPVLS